MDMKMTRPQKRAMAVKFYEQARALLRQQGGIFLEIGRILKILRDERLFEELGDYQTWTQFLNDGRIGLRHSVAYAYISIYEIYVMKFGIPPDQLAEVPWDKLEIALPLARKAETRDAAEEVVAKARELSRSDLRVEVGEVVEQETGYKTRVVKAIRCDDCGGYRVDVKLCTCKRG